MNEILRTKDGEWEEEELAGLCRDECLSQCDQIHEDMKQGKNMLWLDKTLLNTMDLYVATFGDICLVDKYDELSGLEQFENWMCDAIAAKIQANKFKGYIN